MRVFSKFSIKNQIIVISIILIAIIPLTSVIAFKQSSKVIIQQSTEYNMELMSNLKHRVSDKYTNVSGIITNLGYNNIVQDFLVESDPLQAYKLSLKVQSLMKVIKSIYPDIIDIVIVNASDMSTSLIGKTEMVQHMMNEISDQKKDIAFGGYIKASPILIKDSLLFGMNLFATSNTHLYGEKIGFISVILDTEAIQSEIDKFPQLSGTSFYLRINDQLAYKNTNNLHLNNDQLSHYSNWGEKNSIEKIDGNSYIIQSFALPEINGNIISAIPTKNLINKLEILKRTSYMMLTLSIILLTIPYSILLVNILRPLGQLMSFMNQLKGENLEILQSRVQLEGYAEIKIISNHFNIMLNRISNLTQQLLKKTSELYQVDIKRQRAELSFLQSQINPHFLSNTLDTIKGIAIVKGNQEIYDMSAALSRILRYSIKGSNLVSLEEELKIVNSYITLHQVRFPGKISFEQNIPRELYHVLMPKMIIQPFVENAICHGLEQYVSGGKIIIHASCQQERYIELLIIDNGVGIEPKQLKKIINNLHSKDDILNQHIGIKNVNDRIRLQYGENYGVNIFSKVGSGTTIRISLPYSQNLTCICEDQS